MSQISDVLRTAQGNRLHFYCPACREMHGVPVHVDGEPPNGWHWNGNKDKPTFHPSLGVSSYHMDPPYVFGLPKPKEQRRVDTMCHFYVINGQIVFLADCTHQYAGQTVDMVKLAAVNMADTPPI